MPYNYVYMHNSIRIITTCCLNGLICVLAVYLGLCCSSLKIWTVSVLLDAHRNCASALKDSELMLTYLTHKTEKHKTELSKHYNRVI